MILIYFYSISEGIIWNCWTSDVGIKSLKFFEVKLIKKQLKGWPMQGIYNSCLEKKGVITAVARDILLGKENLIFCFHGIK